MQQVLCEVEGKNVHKDEDIHHFLIHEETSNLECVHDNYPKICKREGLTVHNRSLFSFMKGKTKKIYSCFHCNALSIGFA